MKPSVFSAILKQHKVFDPVIIHNPVYVVDNFFGFKITSKIFFHNKSMFLNSFMVISKRMFWGINPNISLCRFPSSSFPTRMSFPTFYPRVTQFRTNFFGQIFIPRRVSFFKKGSSRGITRMSFNKSAQLISHSITSKLKAAFRFLTDSRLSDSTLLAAYCEHNKSANPLDNISISRNWVLSR